MDIDAYNIINNYIFLNNYYYNFEIRSGAFAAMNNLCFGSINKVCRCVVLKVSL